MSGSGNFELLSIFLQQCIKNNKINHIQKNHILGQFLDGNNIMEILTDLRINDDYQKLVIAHQASEEEIQKNKLIKQQEAISTREQERIEQERIYQRGIIVDEIRKLEGNNNLLNDELIPLKDILTRRQEIFNNWYQRHQQFPENPNILKEYERERLLLDEQNVLCLAKQEEIDKIKTDIQNWYNELQRMDA